MQDTQANNIQKKLETLLSEHKELDDMINSMITTQVFDQLQLQRLKKKKTKFKRRNNQIKSFNRTRYNCMIKMVINKLSLRIECL